MARFTCGICSSGCFSRTRTFFMTWGKTTRSLIRSSRRLPLAATICNTRSAVSSPSPVVASPSRKMMCPDCSPPSTAPLFCISLSTYLSPTGARSRRIPSRRSTASSPMFDMVVPTTTSPANRLRAFICRATSSVTPSPFTTRPRESANRQRSASPSKVMPSAAPLRRVCQLVAIVPENFYAVIRPGIVRRRDHHARGELTHARQVRHARRGQHAGRFHCHPSFFQSCGHGGRDPSAGFARVFSHHHPRASMRARQIMPQRPPDDPRGSFIQRKASRHAADAIGAKQRALPSFHFCGDRQDAINGGGFLILPRTGHKRESLFCLGGCL